MGKELEIPKIERIEFDSIEPAFRQALTDWWADESQGIDTPPERTAAIWEGVPEVDSKAVVKASPIVREFIGIELDPFLIRKGGYGSLDDLLDDLLPKLRDLCPSSQNQDQSGPVESQNLETRVTR